MHASPIRAAIAAAAMVALVNPVQAANDAAPADGPACVGYGPQTPRDIDNLLGTNARIFPQAPPSDEMNLCDIHFHNAAEHKAKEFSVYAGEGGLEGKPGVGGGYQCGAAAGLSQAQLAMPAKNACGDVNPGDTIEVHWVYTSCDVTPGPGLGSCLTESCANPTLRVESQVFVVANDPNAMDFMDYAYGGHQANGFHQTKALPNTTGAPVQFPGSTTGPKFNNASCSPLQVSWSVRPQCAMVSIDSLSKWCESNAFDEHHAHGVRQLVTDPEMLAPIE